MVTGVDVEVLAIGVRLRTYKSCFPAGAKWGVISNDSYVNLIKI